jgi:hypothetical protein
MIGALDAPRYLVQSEEGRRTGGDGRRWWVDMDRRQADRVAKIAAIILIVVLLFSLLASLLVR